MSDKPRFTSDPLAEQRAAVVEAVRKMHQPSLSHNVLSALDNLSAAERALAQPEPEPLQECKCGATPTMTQGSEPPCRMAQVVCAECGRRGPNCWTVATAAAAWNARPERGDARAAIGELVAAANALVQTTFRLGIVSVLPNSTREEKNSAQNDDDLAETRFAAAKAAAEALAKGE